MYLIVGGSGFIGTRLCRRLVSSKKEFLILDKSISKSFPEKCIEENITDLDRIISIESNASTIINLAAEHRDDVRPKSLYYEVNVTGAEHVCALAEKENVKRIVFTSSVAVYGFAVPDTDETGEIQPFNDYGITKYKAEQVYKDWQNKDPENRSLIIVRPTVVFGEQNRGNVYNLLKQIASGKFVMVGNGKNRKSMAYVENIAAFLEHASTLEAGIHIFNYIDKPDFNMNSLVGKVKQALGKDPNIKFRLPYWSGLTVGFMFDAVSKLTKKNFPISSIRVQKFCKDSAYSSSVDRTNFIAPIDLEKAISDTIKYEFIDEHEGEVFYSE